MSEQSLERWSMLLAGGRRGAQRADAGRDSGLPFPPAPARCGTFIYFTIFIPTQLTPMIQQCWYNIDHMPSFLLLAVFRRPYGVCSNFFMMFPFFRNWEWRDYTRSLFQMTNSNTHALFCIKPTGRSGRWGC